MPAEFLEGKPRDFSPVSISGPASDARDGINGALEAVSNWRNEIVATNERNTKRVIEQMATAASALGWPQHVVDTARTQLLGIADMQIKTMDQLTRAWEEQIKLTNPMTASPSAMLSKLKSLPNQGTSGATNPLELWMQLAEQWQRALTGSIALWGKRH